MNRRDFLRYSALTGGALSLTGCGFWRIKFNHVLLRSDIIRSGEDEQRILAKAKVEYTDDGEIRVLYVRGSAYERGYQHGALLRKQVQENILYLWDRAISKFRSEELFAEVFERMRPFMSQEHVDEMHGLAHGAQIPLSVVHYIHVLADIGEWGGKKRLGKIIKDMMKGVDFGTMCSNIGAEGSATADGSMQVVRILDWGLHKISKLHKFPLITVGVPDKGIPYANIGWVGYLGAVSGMNAQGITLGEMGYRNPDNETLNGTPMPFMLRDVMTYAHNLAEVRSIIEKTPPTNSYVFMMSDGKSREMEMYVRDYDRFLVFKPGVHVVDTKDDLPAIKDIVYGGRYNDRLTRELTNHHGKITPQVLMKQIIPELVMPSNFQNVIYLPEKLQFYVNNAASKDVPAVGQPYTFFDLGKALNDFAPGIRG